MLCFKTHFLVAYFLILLLQVDVTLLHLLGAQFKRCDDIRLTVLRAAECSPRTFLLYLFLGTTWLIRRQHHLLHHLSDDAVRENHRRIAVFKCQIKGETNKVGHFLNAVGSKGYDIIVAIAATACSLEIVCL